MSQQPRSEDDMTAEPQEPEASRRFAEELADHISKTFAEPQEPRPEWADDGRCCSEYRCNDCPVYAPAAPVVQEPAACPVCSGTGFRVRRDEDTVEKLARHLYAIDGLTAWHWEMDGVKHRYRYRARGVLAALAGDQ